MHVVITGGTGLIGSRLAQRLIEVGHQVTILSRSPENQAAQGSAAVARWDARTAKDWQPVADQADAIVNLAGENIGGGLWTASRKEKILSSRISAGEAVTEAVLSAKRWVRVVVQASGVGVYGMSRTAAFDESSPVGKDWMANTAVAWENSTQKTESADVRRVIIRSGVVLARGEGILPRYELPFRLFVGGPLGNGKQWVSWIHIEDEIEAIRYLLENEEANGPINLVAPQPVTQAEFGRALGRALRRPYWFPAPAIALRIVLGEMSSLVLEGQKVLPKRLTQLGFQFRFPQLKDAFDDLYRRD